MRDTLESQAFIQVPGVSPDLWVYVLDTKTLAGREPRDALDAQARPLVVSFFERDPSADALSLVVRRVNREADGLQTKAITVAELLVHLGYPAPPDPNMSASDKELILEKAFLELQTLVFDSHVVTDHGGIHVYQLDNPRDSEDAFMDSMPLAEHTKFALARLLERRHGWDKHTIWKKKPSHRSWRLKRPLARLLAKPLGQPLPKREAQPLPLRVGVLKAVREPQPLEGGAAQPLPQPLRQPLPQPLAGGAAAVVVVKEAVEYVLLGSENVSSSLPSSSPFGKHAKAKAPTSSSSSSSSSSSPSSSSA